MNASSTDGAYRARGARPLTQGYVEDEADTAIFAGHAAASNQAVGIRKLEAVAGRHAEHRSAEKHPGIKLVLGQPEGDVVDGLPPGARIAGILSSRGPSALSTRAHCSAVARFSARTGSSVSSPVAQIDGPRSSKQERAGELGSALRIRLMSP